MLFLLFTLHNCNSFFRFIILTPDICFILLLYHYYHVLLIFGILDMYKSFPVFSLIEFMNILIKGLNSIKDFKM